MTDRLRPPAQNPPRGKADGRQYEILSTACPYCSVGCGYQVHLWEPGRGTEAPAEDTKNLWVSPSWIGPVHKDGRLRTAAVVPDPKCPVNRGNHSIRGGTLGETLTFSPADGAEADATRDRLRQPMVRVAEDRWAAVSWERMFTFLRDLVARATGYDGERFHEPQRLGVKMYGYHSLESTYAATRLLYEKIGTPNIAFYDRAGSAESTGGMVDSGIHYYAAAYEDIFDCDVVVLLGNNPFETQSVVFQQAVCGRKLMVVDPRRTLTADYAARTGGMHLQPTALGLDALLVNAISRRIVETYKRRKGPELDVLRALVTDTGIKAFKGDFSGDPVYRRATFRHQSVDEFISALNAPHFQVGEVSRRTGIPEQQIKEAAELLSAPELRVGIFFEKGLLWGYNYQATAAVANLAILTFNFNAPNRPGETSPHDAVLQGLGPEWKRGFCGRLTGRQKGWAEISPYPIRRSSEWCVRNDGAESFQVPQYLDWHLAGWQAMEPQEPTPDQPHWAVNDAGAPGRGAQLTRRSLPAEAEDVSVFWVIGCNPAAQMADAARKWKKIARRTRRNGERPRAASAGAAEMALLPPRKSAGGRGDAESAEAAMSEMLARVDPGLREDGQLPGLVIIQQDIYPNYTTEFADVILPCKAWGEASFTRSNSERRLRIYDRFQDPPKHSDCLADWEIFQHVYNQFAHGPGRLRWKDSSEVFDEMAATPRAIDLEEDFHALRQYARERGTTGHGILRERGTRGVQWPVTLDQGALKETATWQHEPRDRCAEMGRFGPFFQEPRWEDVEARASTWTLLPHELWIPNGRVNELWNTMFSNIRNEYLRDRYPADWDGTLLEVNEPWARQQGLQDGDVVEVMPWEEAVAQWVAGVRPAAVASLREELAYACHPHGHKSVDVRARVQDWLGRNDLREEDFEADLLHPMDRLRPPFTRSFLGVVSFQDSVPENMAFALMAYPCRSKSRDVMPGVPAFTDAGYVNNITSNYVDPANPVAALKLAKGMVRRNQAYGPVKMKACGQRGRAFMNDWSGYGPQASPVRTERWRAREALVALGLPRIHVQGRDRFGHVHLSATHGPFWRTSHASLPAFLHEPVMGQFYLVDPGYQPDRSLLVQMLRGDPGVTPMPMMALAIPSPWLRRVQRWIARGCPPEEFPEIQHLLDAALRVHARLIPSGPPGEVVAIETLMRDPDAGVDILGRRLQGMLGLFAPGPDGPMAWRDEEGGLIQAWRPGDSAVMQAWEEASRPLTVRAASGMTFDRVRQLLNDATRDGVRALHGAFWNRLDRDEFVRHRVLFAGGTVPLIHHGQGASSPLVQALRGTGPFADFRMPLGGIKVDDIDAIERWIDDGCP